MSKKTSKRRTTSRSRDYQAVRITAATREKLDRAVGILAQEGWKAFDCESTAPPTLGSVIDAGVDALLRRSSR